MINLFYRNVWKLYYHRGNTSQYRFYANDRLQSLADKEFKDLMSKDQHLFMVQRHREKLKTKAKHYVPSKVTLQVLGSGARGAPTCLYVSSDHTKYMFNCGEGTQRLAFEHHLRLSKLEHIFITTPKWKNMGGLPGIALTVQDNGVPHIHVHGPRGSADLFKAVESFVILKDLTVSEVLCSDDDSFVDQTMAVKYVRLTNGDAEFSSDGESDSVILDNVDYYAYEVNRNGKRSSRQEQNLRKIAKLESLVKSGRITDSMAYICKLHPKAGTLVLEKCVDKGIPPGPLLGELKAGKDVTLADGTVVLSSEVCAPMDPGPVFIVLECPSKDYLDSLTNCEAFVNHQSSAEDKTEIASCVVHFTPENVLSDPRYRRWMEKFPSTTRHIIINEENRCPGSEAIHRIQHQLHLLHPNIFPIMNTEGIKVDKEYSEVNALLEKQDKINRGQQQQNQVKIEEIQEEFPLIQRTQTLDTVHLRPPCGFDRSNELVIKPRDYMDEAFANDGFLDVLAELQTEINAREKNGGDRAEYPKIVMLGTGSCIPNKTRNTSGILLRIDEERSIVLDCGEGTAGQLVRFYGRTEVDKVLLTIKAIYVSHLHADHHLGLIGLLNERERVTKEPLLIMAPKQISSWLHVYHKRFEPIAKKYIIISNRNLFPPSEGESVSAPAILTQALRGIRVHTTYVQHCPHAFGVSFTLEDGRKIVYSGDTIPCDALVQLGADCDLLIHEATMEDELINEAKLKFHSTISQAIGIGERMKAKFILLTHFSQRYSKIPLLPGRENTSPNLSHVGIAYDNMQVSLSQLDILPLLYPPLKLLFSEFCNLLEVKAVKRQCRLERDTARQIMMRETVS